MKSGVSRRSPRSSAATSPPCYAGGARPHGIERLDVSRIIGRNIAVQQAQRRTRAGRGIAVQTSRLLTQPEQRQRFVEAVQTVTTASVTVVDVHVLAQISVDAEQQKLEPAQVESAIRERTPFEALLELLPKDRGELYAFLALLVAVLQLVVSLRAPEQPRSMTPQQVEQVIERVRDQVEQEAPAVTSPPSSTSPPTTSTAPVPTSTAPSHRDHHEAR